MAMWARASLFRPFMDTSIYGTGSVKIWKTRYQMYVDIRIFFTVYVLLPSLVVAARAAGRVITDQLRLSLCVCLSLSVGLCVHALKGKQRELSTPN